MIVRSNTYSLHPLTLSSRAKLVTEKHRDNLIKEGSYTLLAVMLFAWCVHICRRGSIWKKRKPPGTVPLISFNALLFFGRKFVPKPTLEKAQVPNRFLVAFSYSSEQREQVRSIAEQVSQILGSPTVFFDEWFDYYLVGDDGDLKLQEIYGSAVLVVVCVSRAYGKKPWTLDEFQIIRARQMKSRSSKDRRHREAVFYIRVGRGDVKGIPLNTIILDVRKKSHKEAAQLIVKRLRSISD